MHTIFTNAVLVALLSLVGAVVATPSLQLSLSGASTAVGASNLKVVATVTNTGDEVLRLLHDPNGPLSKLPADTFTLTHESGSSPNFVGIRAKYVPSVAIQSNAFTVLAPGQSVSVEHDLSEAYDFTRSGVGQYSITANDRFLFVDPESGEAKKLQAQQSNVHATSISGQLTVERPSLSRRETYTKCSTDQQTTLAAAALAAQTYAAQAFSYLEANTAATDRFNTWFGTYSGADHTTVLTHFTNLNSNNYSSYAFDCSCTDYGVWAYSRPTVFGKVFLCGSFWTSPLTGTDSQGGTLIHESTHFVANAGTQDYAYGQTDATSLAQTDPSEAIMNADNHEYFAENNPVLA